MSNLVTGSDPICQEICTSLGLKNVKRFNLLLDADGLAEVTVTYYPERQELIRLAPKLALLEPIKIKPICPPGLLKPKKNKWWKL